MPTYADANASDSCPITVGRNEPFVVDWPVDKRADLEAALSRKLAVVAYDCKRLTVLPRCELDGGYSFIGLTEREQLLRIESADELRVNLPLSGSILAGRLGGDLSRGASLDIALAVIGKKSATRRAAFRADLQGECGGATHFVRSATLGAFAMTAAAKARVTTAADVFTLSANASSGSGRFETRKDGDLSACRGASPDAEAPAAKCAAPVRIELQSIDEQPSPESKPPPDVAATTCPRGLVSTDEGVCVKPRADVAHLCTSGDAADCAVQCDHGSMASCALLGRMYQVGNGVTADPARALSFLRKACDGRVVAACGRLGEGLLASTRDSAEGLALLQKSCADGWVESCNVLARRAFQNGGSGQKIDAFALFKRSCDGGNPEGCFNLGAMFVEGIGVRQNDAEAARWLERACIGGAKLGCSSYAKLVDEGRGTQQDTAKAIRVLRDACDRGYASSCSGLSDHYMLGKGVERNVTTAVSLLERACDGGETAACLILGMRHNTGVGVPRDTAKAAGFFRRACDGGVLPACQALKDIEKK